MRESLQCGSKNESPPRTLDEGTDEPATNRYPIGTKTATTARKTPAQSRPRGSTVQPGVGGYGKEASCAKSKPTRTFPLHSLRCRNKMLRRAFGLPGMS